MKNKNVGLLILTLLFIISLALGGYGLYLSMNGNSVQENTENETGKDTEDIVSSISDMSKAAFVIKIYKSKYSDVETYIVDDDGYEDDYKDNEYYVLIGEYGCNQKGCIADTFSNNADSNIIVKDDMYYIYNYNSKVSKKLNMEVNNYQYINQVLYNNKVYGYMFLDSDEENGSYYSLVNKEEYKIDKYYSSYKNYYIFKDDDKYFEYNIIDDTATTLPLENKEYEYINYISYSDKLYGYIFKEDNDKLSFYSLKDKKITLKDIPADQIDYFNLSDCSKASLIDNNIVINNILYNYSTKEIIHDFNSQLLPIDIDDYEGEKYSIVSYGNEKAIYYFASNEGYSDDENVYIFNENFELMFSGQKFIMYDVTDDGNLILVDETPEYDPTTYKIYDKEGKLIFTSKKYNSIVTLSNGYIAVVDADDYLKLLDYDGNLVTKIVKITDKLTIHPYLSGYYDYKGIRGIYIVVADSTITTESDAGYGYEYYYDIDTKKVGKILTEIGGYAKPVLYLYPTTKTNVSVKFAKPKLLTTTYPKYKNSWNVIASPNGDLYDKENKYYYGLYWEETGTIDVNFERGFYVTEKNTIEFLESKLTEIGLNSKERNEFIMYWLPILEKNKKNLVYFEFTESRQKYNELIINPKPDSMLRFAIHIKKVEKEVKIKEQIIPKFERKGFAAIEWGGVIH